MDIMAQQMHYELHREQLRNGNQQLLTPTAKQTTVCSEQAVLSQLQAMVLELLLARASDSGPA